MAIIGRKPNTAHPSVNSRVGQIIKRRRKELGLTQEQVGRHIGRTPQQVHKYEAGINGMSVEVLELFADALSTTCVDIIAGATGGSMRNISRERHLQDKLAELRTELALARPKPAIQMTEPEKDRAMDNLCRELMR